MADVILAILDLTLHVLPDITSWLGLAPWRYIGWLTLDFSFVGIFLGFIYGIVCVILDRAQEVRRLMIKLQNTTSASVTKDLFVNIFLTVVTFLGMLAVLLVLHHFFSGWWFERHGIYLGILIVAAMPLMYPRCDYREVGGERTETFRLAKVVFALHLGWCLAQLGYTQLSGVLF